MKIFGNPNRIIWIAIALLEVVVVHGAPPTMLENAPQATRLWLGIEEGVIRPASFEQIRAETEQFVEVHVADGTIVEKGLHWATLDPEMLELEQRGFEIDVAKSKRQLQKELSDLEEERLRVLLARQEAVVKRSELLAAGKDHSLPADLQKRSRKAAEKLLEKIALLDEQLGDEVIAEQRALLEKSAVLQLDRKRKQLDSLQKRSRIQASCDGTLVLGDSIRLKLKQQKSGEPVWMKTNEVLGVVRNDQRYEVWVNAEGPLLSNLPREQMMVLVQDARTGQLIDANYDRIEEFDSGSEIKRTYVFVVEGDGVESAKSSLGVRSMVHIYRRFEKPFRLVYKKDIAMLDTQILENAGWAGLVQKLWPGSKVIQVGPQTIAVQPKYED